MDRPTREGVAGLVRQRADGQISCEEFFQRLSVFQAPPDVQSIDVSSHVSELTKGHTPVDIATAVGLVPSPARSLCGSSVESLSLLTRDSAGIIVRQASAQAPLVQDERVGAGWDAPAVSVAEPFLGQAWATPREFLRTPRDHREHENRWDGGASDDRRLMTSASSPADSVPGHSSPFPVFSSEPHLLGYAEPGLIPESRSANSTPRSLRGSVGSASIDSAASTFMLRSEVWDTHRSRKTQELRKRRESLEVAECSFHPKVNVSSARSSSGARVQLTSQGASQVSSRLAAPPPSARRHSFAAQIRAQREQKENQECTFSPDFSSSASVSSHLRRNKAGGSSSKTLLPANDDRAFSGSSEASVATSPAGLDSNMAGFVPRTNPVAQNMINAQAYLKKDVFSRLSEPQPQPESVPAERDLLDGKPGHSALCTVDGTQSCASTTDSTIIGFLQRQNLLDEQRRERYNQLIASQQPSTQPCVNARSRQLVARSRAKQQCQEDPATTGRSRGSLGSRASETDVQLKECSFRPQINPDAQARRSRSVSELSSGDKGRQEAKVSKLREQLDAKTRREETFAPRIKTLSGVHSQIRVLEEPDSYLERLERKRCAGERRREQELQKREAQETSECTFRPQVTVMPDYISQMAQSHRMVRSLKERESKDQGLERDEPRPDWR